MASSREIRGLAIAGTPALIHGYRPEVPCTVYSYKGALYELDQSQETAEWAAEGTRTRRLGPGLFHLEAIIGEKTEDGETKYLAKWVGTDESTYEHAKNFKPEDLAEYQAEKARLAEIEMDLDLDDLVLADDTSTTTALSPAPLPTVAEVTSRADSVGSSDIEMTDTDHVTTTTTDVSDDAEALHISSTDMSSSTDPSNGAEEEDDDEADDECPLCDDPFGSGLVDKHGTARVCEGVSAASHPDQNIYTCDACRRETTEMLTPEQKDAIENGADRPLCQGCGQDHIDDSEASFDCVCVTEALCGGCFWTRADNLAAARRTLIAFYDETVCATCDEELVGDETVTKCALCRGLKVRS